MMKKETGAIEKLDKITTIAMKRGFFWPTAEIYGGKAGFYSYGHLGKALKQKFEHLWRLHFLEENCYEIEGSCILPEPVFIASGHLENFNDPLIECKTCHFRFRADQFLEDNNIKTENMSIDDMTKIIAEKQLKCPKCGSWHLGEAKWFNMMFPIALGAAGVKDTAYLTPETAQASYLSFKREFEATRKQLPLGIAIISKAFRNEISPRQLLTRQREFTQAELQMFFDKDEINNLEDRKWKDISKYNLILLPQKAKAITETTCEEANKKLKIPKFYLYYMALTQKFYLDKLQVPKKSFRFRELSEKERAFYNKIHWDMELELDTLGGFREMGGIHYRTDHDLLGHEKHSKENLHIFFNNKSFIPHVIEVSLGVDRDVWAFLDLFYKEEKERTLFTFPKTLAPVDVAIFPLVSKEKMPDKALDIYSMLKDDFSCFYDETDSIGRRYRRQDEIGTPYCITVDGQTMKDNTVTIRARDSMKQVRVKIEKLKEELRK